MIIYYLSKAIKKLRGKAVKGSIIDFTSKVESGSQVINSKFGRYSFCGYDCDINNCDIGSFCSIANGVVIGGGMHPLDWVGTSPVFYEGRDSVKAKFAEFKRPNPKRTVIGNDVWIGQNVLIKQGVTIGTGAVVGMGSVVTKDVEPYAIVVGVPAILIRYRFDQHTIDNLLKSKWWEFSADKLIEYAKYIDRPEVFLKMIEE